jgi:hypothetical protein
MAIGVEQPELRIAADELRFPEGPVALPAGSMRDRTNGSK